MSNYTIAFTTTVALVLDTDTITLVGPAGTVFPLVAADYTINGTAPNVTPTGGGTTVTLTTHVAAAAGSVTVVASRVTNPAAGTPTLTVATSKEPAAVASSTYTITAATAVSAVTATVSPAKVSPTTALYTVHATTASLLVSGYDSITLNGPAGTTFPLVAADYSVTAGGAATAVSALPTQTSVNNVTIVVPAGSTGGSAPVALTVTASGVTNPPTAGTTYNLAVSETADSGPATSANYTIGALTAVSAVTVTPSAALAGATSNYTIGFTTATALVINADTITIVGPTGTVFPAGAGAYSVNGTASNVAPTVTGSSVTFITHVAAAAGAVSVVITGVTNPAGGSKTLTVSTSEDSIPVTSPAYVITTAITGTPTVTTNPATATAVASYAVGFTATSALTAGTDTITLVAASGTLFPLVASDYTINGAAVTTLPTGTAGNVTLTTPVSVAAAGVVSLVAIGVTNPAAATRTLTVATSTDVSPATSAVVHDRRFRWVAGDRSDGFAKSGDNRSVFDLHNRLPHHCRGCDHVGHDHHRRPAPAQSSRQLRALTRSMEPPSSPHREAQPPSSIRRSQSERRPLSLLLPTESLTLRSVSTHCPSQRPVTRQQQ